MVFRFTALVEQFFDPSFYLPHFPTPMGLLQIFLSLYHLQKWAGTKTHLDFPGDNKTCAVYKDWAMELVECSDPANQWFVYDSNNGNHTPVLTSDGLDPASSTLLHRSYICEARILHTVEGGSAGGPAGVTCHFPFRYSACRWLANRA